MIAKLHVPASPLSQFIENFYYYCGFVPEHTKDRFLPDGNVQIIIDLTEFPKYIYDNETLKEIQACTRVWFSGFRTEPITIPSGNESEMLIVNFRKGKAFPFLTVPLQALTNHVVDAELVLTKEILDLRERMRDAVTIEKKIELLESYLLDQYLNELHENPFVDFAISKIQVSPDQTSIREISEKVGYSQKHLIKIFRDHVGVTPKEFLKIIRFQKIIEEIESDKNINWSTVALDCGFFDQSHFISDFKKYSGFTPAEYLKIRGDQRNYIPVD